MEAPETVIEVPKGSMSREQADTMFDAIMKQAFPEGFTEDQKKLVIVEANLDYSWVNKTVYFRGVTLKYLDTVSRYGGFRRRAYTVRVRADGTFSIDVLRRLFAKFEQESRSTTQAHDWYIDNEKARRAQFESLAAAVGYNTQTYQNRFNITYNYREGTERYDVKFPNLTREQVEALVAVARAQGIVAEAQ